MLTKSVVDVVARARMGSMGADTTTKVDGSMYIWRVLHARRDIPTYLTSDQPD